MKVKLNAAFCLSSECLSCEKVVVIDCVEIQE